MAQRGLISPKKMFEEDVHQFTRVLLDDGREVSILSATADGILLDGGVLVFWEQRRIRKVAHQGNLGVLLHRPTSCPVVIRSKALRLNRTRDPRYLAARARDKQVAA